MTKQIIPSSYAERCPICCGQLKLINTLGDKNTSCSQCDYQEPAGNAIVVTFLSACISEYATLYEIDTVFLQGNEFTVRECMEGDGLLPLFVERANQIQKAADFSDIPELGLQLTTIEDIKGLQFSRVVLKTSTINVGATLGFIGEVFNESMALTRTLNRALYGNQISLDYMPSQFKLDNASETSTAKLHSAFIAATKHQSLGGPSDQK